MDAQLENGRRFSFWRVFFYLLAVVLGLEFVVLTTAWVVGLFPKTGEQFVWTILFGPLMLVLVGGVWALFPRKKADK